MGVACVEDFVHFDSPGGSSGSSEHVQKWVDSLELHDG